MKRTGSGQRLPPWQPKWQQTLLCRGCQEWASSGNLRAISVASSPSAKTQLNFKMICKAPVACPRPFLSISAGPLTNTLPLTRWDVSSDIVVILVNRKNLIPLLWRGRLLREIGKRFKFRGIVKCIGSKIPNFPTSVVVISAILVRNKTLVLFCGNIGFCGTIEALFPHNNTAPYRPPAAKQTHLYSTKATRYSYTTIRNHRMDTRIYILWLN